MRCAILAWPARLDKHLFRLPKVACGRCDDGLLADHQLASLTDRQPHVVFAHEVERRFGPRTMKVRAAASGERRRFGSGTIKVRAAAARGRGRVRSWTLQVGAAGVGG